MLRDSLVKALWGQEQHFRWRGNEVSRIENLSDAVFGFSIARRRECCRTSNSKSTRSGSSKPSPSGRRAAELELDARERLLTRDEVHGHGAHAVVALALVATAVLVSPALAGWLYFLLFPLGWVQGALLSRALRRLDAAGA